MLWGKSVHLQVEKYPHSYVKNLKGNIYIKHCPWHDTKILLHNFDSFKFDHFRLWHEQIYLFVLDFLQLLKK